MTSFNVWALPPGCGFVFNVDSVSGVGNFTSIQSAVNALPVSISSAACVVIIDTSTYAEQVTVQKFAATGGYTGTLLQIMSDPSFISSAPVVTPPANSTAAFQVMNASVTIQGINIVTTNALSYGVYASSSYVAISSVSIRENGGAIGTGVYLSRWDTVSRSTITASDNGIFIDVYGYSNTIQQSSITSTGHRAIYIVDASSFNTISQCMIQQYAGSGNGVELQGSSYNSISQSTIIAPGNSAFYLGGAGFPTSYNTFTQLSLYGDIGFNMKPNASFNSISQSTISLNTATGLPVYMIGASSNVFTRDFFSNSLGGAVFLDVNANNNAINQSTITSNGAGFSALSLNSASSNTITTTYIQGSTAVYVSGSTGTVITSSVLVATNTSGNALQFSVGSVFLTLTDNIFRGGPQGAGIYLDKGGSGSISLTSNTIIGGRWGLYVTTQVAGTSLSITTMTFSGGMAAGATAIQFGGGTFVSTFTGVNFSDLNIAVNVNGAPLSLASRITMRVDSGAKTGPSFESDPSNLVDWPNSVPNQPPSNPSIAGSQIYPSSVTVAWGLVGGSAYIVQASTASDFTGTLFVSSTTDITISFLSVYGLTLNTTYYFRAGALWGSTTFYANTTPSSAVTLANTPSPLNFTGIAALQFTVNWPANNNPNTTLYVVNVSTDINFGIVIATAATTALTSTFSSGLSANATYFVRVQAFNSAGTPSSYALGAVITVTGIITISANRLPGVWYNVASAVFFAQGATNYRYRLSALPVDTPSGTDPLFDGSGLTLPTLQGAQYFHVLGVGGPGNNQVAHFGPIDIDTGSPIIASISAQNSAADTTPIPNGGTTIATTPRFTWPAAGSVSPIVGYSFSISTDAAAVPSASITTTINFIDKILSFSGIYYAKVSALNLAGSLGPPVLMSFTFTTTPSSQRYVLKHNILNPLRGECSLIEIDTTSAGHLKAEVYNLLGERVATLADADVIPGVYNYSWCGKNSSNQTVSSGIYLLHLETPNGKSNFKIGVLK